MLGFWVSSHTRIDGAQGMKPTCFNAKHLRNRVLESCLVPHRALGLPALGSAQSGEAAGEADGPLVLRPSRF